MSRVVISARARADLNEIGAYIARDSRAQAKRLLAQLRARCASLAEHPLRGRVMPSVGPDVPVSVIGNYLILYRVLDHAVAIDRVVHRARDFTDLLGDD